LDVKLNTASHLADIRIVETGANVTVVCSNLLSPRFVEKTYDRWDWMKHGALISLFPRIITFL
jgi:hypothetical protein